MSQPSATIETPRLLLRPFEDGDLEDLARLNGDPEVMRHISEPLTRERVRQVIRWFQSEWERLGFGWFAIIEKETGEFAGQCGLQNLEGKTDAEDVELAFVISPEYWRMGYATEAARAVVSFGFTRVRLPRITAVTVAQNAVSRRVLAKLGFRVESTRQLYDRESLFYVLDRGVWEDSRRQGEG